MLQNVLKKGPLFLKMPLSRYEEDIAAGTQEYSPGLVFRVLRTFQSSFPDPNASTAVEDLSNDELLRSRSAVL